VDAVRGGVEQPDPPAAEHQVAGQRQLAQPLPVVGGELLVPPAAGLVVIVRGVLYREEVVPVAADGERAPLPAESDRGRPARSLPGHVPQVVDRGDTAGVDVGQDSLESGEVAVDVGEESDALSRGHRGEPSAAGPAGPAASRYSASCAPPASAAPPVAGSIGPVGRIRGGTASGPGGNGYTTDSAPPRGGSL